MRHYCPLLLSILVFASCNTHQKASPILLTDNSFYNIDSVRAAMAGDNDKAGQKKLAQALDTYINRKDPAKSIAIFRDAIRIQPSAKAYFQLGSALLDDSLYEESVRALHIAEQLGYSPLANVMYKLALATGHQPGENEYYKDSLAVSYMEIALQMGYAHPADFLTADGFSKIRNFYMFASAYNKALAAGRGNTTPEKLLWATFQEGFGPVGLPLTIDKNWIRAHKPEKSIEYDYEKFVTEMRNAKFSREVEMDYFYFATLKKDTGYTALIYAGRNNFVGDADGNSPVFYLLTTYDRNGRIIDKMKIAGQSNFTENFKVMTMQPNYTFVINEFQDIYKYDPKEAGYDTNSVIKTEPRGTSTYRIAANGKLEKTDAPLAAR